MEIIILHDKEILSEPQFAAISCAVCANCLKEPYRVGFKKHYLSTPKDAFWSRLPNGCKLNLFLPKVVNNFNSARQIKKNHGVYKCHAFGIPHFINLHRNVFR